MEEWKNKQEKEGQKRGLAKPLTTLLWEKAGTHVLCIATFLVSETYYAPEW